MRRKVYTVPGLNRALRQLPKDLSAEMRDASQDIADDIARRAAGRARSVGGAASLVAPSVKSRRDRVPVVQMGGRTPLPGPRGPNRTNQTVGNVWAGSEYGSRRFSQFQPVKRPGYFLWPTVEDMHDEIADRYGEALTKAMDKL